LNHAEARSESLFEHPVLTRRANSEFQSLAIEEAS
jgi:hypothetical protein